MSIGFLYGGHDAPRDTSKGAICYFKGDLAEYTGKVEHLHGGKFYEVVLLEGHLEGKKRLVV